MEVAGRIRIFTDEKEITRENIIPVLQNAYAKHRVNMRRMQFLIDYHGGLQKLPYEKTVRPEINIQTAENLAKFATTFHSGYFWGIPAVYIQRGNEEHHNTDYVSDSTGISALNEMMINGLSIGKKNQELAYWVEICGIGFRLVDVKTDWDEEEIPSSYVELHTLDSLNAFNIYHNGLGQKKVLGVTFVKSTSGKLMFTCFTDKLRFEISGWKIDEETVNPLGMIPIVEYDRSIDLTGCFESQIDMMDNLNSLVSSFANDSVQRCQEIFFGTNFELPKDGNGKQVEVKSNQWIIAQSTQDGKEPKLQAIASNLNGQDTLSGIESMRNEILKECFIPLLYDSSGGGSTSLAVDSMSGWNSTAVDAARKEQLISGADREQLNLILRAIKYVPSKILPEDDPLKKVHSTDIDIKYIRTKSYDLNTKINAAATAIGFGVNGRHALRMADCWDDVEQVWLDSRDTIEKIQKSSIEKEKEKSHMQDESMQAENSPFVDGMQTKL